MKIVAMSDSHGLREPLEYIQKAHPDADLFIHCGDLCLPKDFAKGFLIVAGNCDDPTKLPLAEVAHLEGHSILILHGHVAFSGTNVNLAGLARIARRNGCDVVFFGHSHIYCDEEYEGVRLLNPGSILANRDMTPPSYMVVDLQKNKITATRKEYTGTYQM